MRKMYKARQKLYEQLELLAEQSRSALPGTEPKYAEQMWLIHKELNRPLGIFVFTCILNYFSIRFFVKLVKLFGRKL